MKSLNKFLILLFASLSLFTFNSCTEMVQRIKDSGNHQENTAEYVSLESDEFNDASIKPNTDTEVLSAGFFPIGWSQGGNFAYYFIPPDEAGAPRNVFLIIQNLITDKKLVDQSMGEVESTRQSDASVLKQVVSKKEKQINHYLQMNGIVKSSDFPILDVPYSHNGNTYDCHIYNRKGYMNYFQLNCIDATGLSLKKNGQIGQKIGSFSYEDGSPDNINRPVKNYIAGCLRSPYENRIAFIYVAEFPGYEKTPYLQHIEIIGCALI
jgi:hypothetical protein